ncbi:NepR family anti-sigma factor [Methylobrevis albus]|nr:NepR family anti-sigma factor [Methylobrevis albus]
MSKSEGEGKRRQPALPADAQHVIGEKLKAMYDEVVRQPVPDRFAQLLAELDGAAAGNTASGKSSENGLSEGGAQ